MKQLLKQLASESAIYGISNMIGKFIALFLIPLYTHLISPGEYGELNLVNSTFYFVIVFAIFAMDNSAARWYYDTEDTTDRKKTIATWFWFQFSMSILLGLIIILISPWLSEWILHENKRIFFILPALGLITNILPGMVSNWLRFQRKAIHTVIFSISNILLNVGLNLWFVYHLKMGVLGILTASLLSNAIASLYVFFLMKDWIHARYFSMSRLKEMLGFAFPLIPTSIAFWVLNSSSGYIIEHFHGKAEVGLYSIGAMLAVAVTMVVGAFQMAWGPFAFSIMEKPEAKKTFSMVLTLYSALMSFVALCVALFGKEALQIFTSKEYQSAYIVGGILAFNGIIYGYAYIASIGSSIAKDNKPLAYAVLMAAIITAVCYFFLVPVYGKEGAALSMVIGYLIVPIYLFYRSQKYWHIPFKFTVSILMVVIAALLYSFSFLFHTEQQGIAILVKIGLLAIYILCLAAITYAAYPEIRTRFRKNNLTT